QVLVQRLLGQVFPPLFLGPGSRERWRGGGRGLVRRLGGLAEHALGANALGLDVWRAGFLLGLLRVLLLVRLQPRGVHAAGPPRRWCRRRSRRRPSRLARAAPPGRPPRATPAAAGRRSGPSPTPGRSTAATPGPRGPPAPAPSSCPRPPSHRAWGRAWGPPS